MNDERIREITLAAVRAAMRVLDGRCASFSIGAICPTSPMGDALQESLERVISEAIKAELAEHKAMK